MSSAFSSSWTAHGQFVAFVSAATNLVAGDTNNTSDVFVRDRMAQVTRRVSVGEGRSAPQRPSAENAA
jgi:hypothetical protein